MTRRALPSFAAGLLALAFACSVAAQAPAATQPATSAAAAAMQSELVTTGLYLISGGGANSLLRFSAQGLVLVDSKSPGTERALMSQVRRIAKLSDMNVRVLLLTGGDAGRTGGAVPLALRGVRIVAAREIVGQWPTTDERAVPPLAFDRAYTLHIGGVQAQLESFAQAHGTGDTVVLFPDLKVVALGDLYTAGPPMPDFAAGGSFTAWSAALGRVLALDFDRAVPATGPIVERAAVEALKARIDTLLARAGAPRQQDVARDALQARLRADDPQQPQALTEERPQAASTPPR